MVLGGGSPFSNQDMFEDTEIGNSRVSERSSFPGTGDIAGQTACNLRWTKCGGAKCGGG